MVLNQFSTRMLYFGAPIAIFIGVRFLAGGPQSSHASTPAGVLNNAPLPQLVRTPQTAPQPDGTVVAASIQAKLSPFWFDQQRVAPVIEHTQQDELEVIDLGGPQIQVSSILPHPTRPLAVINGKPCRLGERVAPDWKLTSIDGDARTITISNSHGEIKIVRISTP